MTSRSAFRLLSTSLALTASLVAIACVDRKPGASSTASSADRSSGRSTSALAGPAFSMAGASASDSTVLRLAAATDTAPAGTSVRIPVAHVQSVMSDRGFWIGVWGQEVYVIQTTSKPVPVQGGEAYTVIGTVRGATHSVQAGAHGMTPIDIDALQSQHVYIAADSVAANAR